jgi:hypothetical protein
MRGASFPQDAALVLPAQAQVDKGPHVAVGDHSDLAAKILSRAAPAVNLLFGDASAFRI